MKQANYISLLFKLLVVLTITSCSNLKKGNIAENTDLSEAGFKNPDKSHYPETWFHFIGGNVSKEGITADLEAIAAAKISGIQLFHGQFGGEWPGVSPQIKCLSESWDELIHWTAEECKRLGLHLTMQNCPGWSYAGGPWITPENSMRHLAYSRTDIEGGNNIDIQLSKPKVGNEEWRDYRDLFIIGFPTPLDDTGNRLLPVEIKSNRTELAWNDCLLQNKTITLKPSSTNEPTLIDVTFDKETTLRTVELPSINSFSHAWCYDPGISITISALKNGDSEQIAQLDLPPGSWQDDKPLSIACKEVKTDSYRIKITNLHDMALSYINFYSAARQQNWESEAGWTLRRIVREPFPQQTDLSWIDKTKIVDLTGKMNADGTFSWDAPEGKWTILRIGHYNTGMRNGPAPAEATGWECNKLDASGVKANFDGYIGRLVKENGALQNGLLQGVLLDSWECRTQTWTNGLDNTFRQKWNYSLQSMLPALFGYVVDKPEVTALFLRDWRVTLNDLLVTNFFGEMKNLAKEHNLRVSFETASGDIFPGDIMEYYKYADIPMCEFWQPRMESYVGSDEFKPSKPTVSAARLYGKKRVAAEAFTSFDLTWDETPRYLKSIIDYHFAQGVTHPVFHTFTHNPRTNFLPPSTSFGSGIGTPFLRLQTWWQHMPQFTDYLARCNYMLENGKPVSDVLMYLGDEQNHKPAQSLPFPKGFSYDYCNPDVLLNRLSVNNGTLVTPEGISYRILWLYDCKRMQPETLEKILSFIKQGVTIVGLRPENIATLSGGKENESRFQTLVNEIWGTENEKIRKIGKGKIYTEEIGQVLTSEKMKPSVSIESDKLNWLHRQSGKIDYFYLSTSPEEGFNGTIAFRSSGFAEIWNPLDGSVTNIETKNNRNGLSEIDIDIPAASSLFVVFRKKQTNRNNFSPNFDKNQEIASDWQIDFPENWGVTPQTLSVAQLAPWNELPLSTEGKSFSGTATYKTTFDIEKQPDNRYLLDLGRVETIAKIKLNGKGISTLWTTPYQTDITDYVVSGKNLLEIAVTSTWFNRLAFDARLPEKERKTWTINAPNSESLLKEYGLLGPVKIRFTEKQYH